MIRLITFWQITHPTICTVAGETHCTTLCTVVINCYCGDNITNLRWHGNNQSWAICQSADHPEADGRAAASHAGTGGSHLWCCGKDKSGAWTPTSYNHTYHTSCGAISSWKVGCQGSSLCLHWIVLTISYFMFPIHALQLSVHVLFLTREVQFMHNNITTLKLVNSLTMCCRLRPSHAWRTWLVNCPPLTTRLWPSCWKKSRP